MTVVAPPPHDDPELLIREARARQRQRRAIAAAVVAGAALAAFGIYGALSRGGSRTHTGGAGYRGPISSSSCGIRVAGTRILKNGGLVYREPAPVAMSSTVRCSGSAVWVVFVNGVGMMHEDYVGVRSGDDGRTWRIVFAQQPGLPSRRGIDAEVGAWTLAGPRTAYFVGACPACQGFGTLSLSVTRDGGRTFSRYPVPGSDAYAPRSIRVRGRRVEIRERRNLGLRLRWRTVIVRVT